jgi:hypothetical protein
VVAVARSFPRQSGWLEEVRDAVDELLTEHGPRAALEELAATLPRPVLFEGDLGGRVGAHVESGLYRSVATVLTALATDADRKSAIAVDLSRDDALRVLVTAPAGRLTRRELRVMLDHDAERLAELGGAMTYTVTAGAAVVGIRLSALVEPAPPALYERVRDLVRQGQQAAGDGPDRPRWDAAAERLTTPARLAVVRDPAAAPGTAPISAPPGVTVIDAEGPADQALAEEFLADDGPRGSVDAVLCLVPVTPAFRATLRWGRQRVTLSESASVDELARTLVMWRPVIAARRAIVTTRDLTTGLPENHPLRWALDRVGADTHEIAELDLLDDLERDGSRLLRGAGLDATADAARLLGAHGMDPRARLGLTADASDDQIRDAADHAVRRWRAHAERPGTGGLDRAACEVLARTAEGVLNAEPTG